MRPECPTACKSQQGRGKRQRRDKYNDEADGDGDACLSELAEVGEDHHSNSADHRSSAGDKGFADLCDRAGNRFYRFDSVVEFFLKASDQKEAVVDSGAIAKHGDVNLDPVEQ